MPMDETVDGDLLLDTIQKRTREIFDIFYLKCFLIVFHCHMIFFCGFDDFVQ